MPIQLDLGDAPFEVWLVVLGVILVLAGVLGGGTIGEWLPSVGSSIVTALYLLGALFIILGVVLGIFFEHGGV